MKWLPALLFLVTTAVLTACTVPTSTVTTAVEATTPPLDFAAPPIIDFAIDTTYPDGRLVTDPRFAAVLVTEAGEVRLFDDIGRMLTQRASSDQKIAAVWVRDYETAEWLPGDTAVFVGSPNLVTPRGSGLLAVSSVELAEQLARELGGQVMALSTLPAFIAAGSAVPLPPSGGGLQLGGLLEADR